MQIRKILSNRIIMSLREHYVEGKPINEDGEIGIDTMHRYQRYYLRKLHHNHKAFQPITDYFYEKHVWRDYIRECLKTTDETTWHISRRTGRSLEFINNCV